MLNFSFPVYGDITSVNEIDCQFLPFPAEQIDLLSWTSRPNLRTSSSELQGMSGPNQAGVLELSDGLQIKYLQNVKGNVKK